MIFALVFAVFVCGTAFASVGVKEEGTMLGAATDIDIVGANVTASGDFGTKTITITPNTIEVQDTTDTTIITAAESGKIFIAKFDTKFQLPAPADGLTYTFVAGSNVEIEIQVDTTPTTIVFAPPEIGNGEGVIETAGTNTTGTTVTLYSDGTSWYVGTSFSGTDAWTDGGEWTELDRGAQS